MDEECWSSTLWRQQHLFQSIKMLVVGKFITNFGKVEIILTRCSKILFPSSHRISPKETIAWFSALPPGVSSFMLSGLLRSKPFLLSLLSAAFPFSWKPVNMAVSGVSWGWYWFWGLFLFSSKVLQSDSLFPDIFKSWPMFSFFEILDGPPSKALHTVSMALVMWTRLWYIIYAGGRYREEEISSSFLGNSFSPPPKTFPEFLMSRVGWD